MISDYVDNHFAYSKGSPLYSTLRNSLDKDNRNTPEKRITEDYLRILRYFRFWSSISTLPIDEKVVALCAKYRDGLDQLSDDRLRDEMFRIIMTPKAEEALTSMKKAGLLTKRILGISFSKKQKEELKKSEISKFLKKLKFNI